MPCDICSMNGKECINEHIARRIANAGYRKAASVARGIFEEIEELLKIYYASGIYFNEFVDMVNKLKKKYTE